MSFRKKPKPIGLCASPGRPALSTRSSARIVTGEKIVDAAGAMPLTSTGTSVPPVALDGVGVGHEDRRVGTRRDRSGTSRRTRCARARRAVGFQTGGRGNAGGGTTTGGRHAAARALVGEAGDEFARRLAATATAAGGERDEKAEEGPEAGADEASTRANGGGAEREDRTGARAGGERHEDLASLRAARGGASPRERIVRRDRHPTRGREPHDRCTEPRHSSPEWTCPRIGLLAPGSSFPRAFPPGSLGSSESSSGVLRGSSPVTAAGPRRNCTCFHVLRPRARTTFRTHDPRARNGKERAGA